MTNDSVHRKSVTIKSTSINDEKDDWDTLKRAGRQLQVKKREKW
jgi:hypothetical protein